MPKQTNTMTINYIRKRLPTVEEMVVPSFILTRELYSGNTNLGHDQMPPDRSMRPIKKEPDLNLSGCQRIIGQVGAISAQVDTSLEDALLLLNLPRLVSDKDPFSVIE